MFAQEVRVVTDLHAILRSEIQKQSVFGNILSDGIRSWLADVPSILTVIYQGDYPPVSIDVLRFEFICSVSLHLKPNRVRIYRERTQTTCRGVKIRAQITNGSPRGAAQYIDANILEGLIQLPHQV